MKRLSLEYETDLRNLKKLVNSTQENLIEKIQRDMKEHLKLVKETKPDHLFNIRIVDINENKENKENKENQVNQQYPLKSLPINPMEGNHFPEINGNVGLSPTAQGGNTTPIHLKFKSSAIKRVINKEASVALRPDDSINEGELFTSRQDSNSKIAPKFKSEKMINSSSTKDNHTQTVKKLFNSFKENNNISSLKCKYIIKA